MKKSFKSLVISGAGFSAGVAAGFLLSSKKGREILEFLSTKVEERRTWFIGQRLKLVEESEHRISVISNSLHDLLPDLYEATSDIHFEEEDLELNE